MTTDTLTKTGNEPADILINTIYTSPVIPLEAARLIEGSIHAALATERRATVERIRAAYLERQQQMASFPDKNVTAILDAEAKR